MNSQRLRTQKWQASRQAATTAAAYLSADLPAFGLRSAEVVLGPDEYHVKVECVGVSADFDDTYIRESVNGVHVEYLFQDEQVTVETPSLFSRLRTLITGIFGAKRSA